jgi:hypothetical protein
MKNHLKNRSTLRYLWFVLAFLMIGSVTSAFSAVKKIPKKKTTVVTTREIPLDTPASTASTSSNQIRYPKKTELDFEGLALQGQVRSPGEFYFQRRSEEKFDSLVKRRKNFHQEMLRDIMAGR